MGTSTYKYGNVRLWAESLNTEVVVVYTSDPQPGVTDQDIWVYAKKKKKSNDGGKRHNVISYSLQLQHTNLK